MPSYKNLRSTSKNRDDDEELIQKVVEKVLTSDSFMKKLIDIIWSEVSTKMELQVQKLEEKVISLENKLLETTDALGQYSRSNNLRFYGIPEQPQEKAEETIINLCKTKLNININETEIDICHRLASREGGTRPIIVKFCRRFTKQHIYNNKSKLKGSKIVIREDLTVRRVGILKAAIKECGVGKVWTSQGKILCIVNGKVVQINNSCDLIQLRHKQMVGNKTARN